MRLQAVDARGGVGNAIAELSSMKAASSDAAAPSTEAKLYDQDFLAWTRRTAASLRARRFDEVDIGVLAEEIEDMGKRDMIEMKSRLRVLLTHLLEWRFPRARRSRSWEATIFTQREEIAALLDESPSLRPRLDAVLAATYAAAVRLAALETGLVRRTFPQHCPFTVDQILDVDFLPT